MSKRDFPVRAALLAAFLPAFFLRSPQTFLDPHLYAEEISIYFLFSWLNGPWEALVTPHLGYYSLLPNVATAVAAHALPLEYAPFATLAAGLGVVLLLAWLVVMRGSPFDTRTTQAIALALIVVVPPAYLRLHTTFSQFYLCACTGLILISSAEPGARAWWRRSTLLLAGLTGVVSVFLAPVFWLKWWLGRSREALIQSAILTSCAIVQGVVLSRTASFATDVGRSRFGTFDLDLILSAAMNQTGIHMFLGTPAFRTVGRMLMGWVEGRPVPGGALLWVGVVGVNLLLVALMLGTRHVKRDPRSLLLLLSYGVVLALSIVAGTTGMQSGTKAAMIAHQLRYFYAPNLFLAFAVLIHAGRAGPAVRTWFYRAVLAWILVAGSLVHTLHTPRIFLEGPSWRREIATWRADPSHGIACWPDGMRRIRLPPR